MENHDYALTYVHKISQLPGDQANRLVTVTPADLTDRKALGACLRRQGVFGAGAAVRSYKVKDNGEISIFPPRDSVWNCFILRPHPPTIALEGQCPACMQLVKVYQRPTRYGYFQKENVDTCEKCAAPIELRDGAVVRRYS